MSVPDLSGEVTFSTIELIVIRADRWARATAAALHGVGDAVSLAVSVAAGASLVALLVSVVATVAGDRIEERTPGLARLLAVGAARALCAAVKRPVRLAVRAVKDRRDAREAEVA